MLQPRRQPAKDGRLSRWSMLVDNDNTQTPSDVVLEEAINLAEDVIERTWYQVLVTPALAAEWLKRNTNNYRAPIPANQARLAGEIQANKFTLTHQAIAFDSHGTLIDGQNRLMAIVAADKPVWLMVAVGFDDRENLDYGAKRTGYDVLMARGETVHSRDAMSLVNTLMEVWGCRGHQREKAEFYIKYRKSIDFAMSVRVSGTAETNKLGRIATWCAVAAAHACGVPESALMEFAHVMRTGVPTDNPGTAVVARLREKIIGNNRPGGSRAVRTDEFKIAGKVIQTVAARKDVGGRIVTPSEMLYTLEDAESAGTSGRVGRSLKKILPTSRSTAA